MLYLGVDLGGTNIKAALVNSEGEILCEANTPTNLPRPAEAVCDDIAALCLQLAEGKDVAGVGVGCPGTVDGGTVLYSNNLDWHDFAMEEYLAQKTGLPVAVGNDANVAALGEALAGCAKGAQSTVVVTLGTGVGAGVVLDGKLLTGYTGAASEAGHMVILDTADAPRCTCGRHGCLEALASATALIRMTKEARLAHPESALNVLAAKPEDVNGRTAFDAAAQGDAAAQQVVDTYIHYLAVGIANLINIFFPEVIGLSGGVANQGENLLKPLRAAVEPMVFGHDFAQKHTRITACTLGYRAGVIGAALLAKKPHGMRKIKMDIKKEYERWLANATADADVAAELKTLDDAKVEDAFYRDLAFGTGGLRGVIGAGTNRMNIYTVAKSIAGLG